MNNDNATTIHDTTQFIKHKNLLNFIFFLSKYIKITDEEPTTNKFSECFNNQFCKSMLYAKIRCCIYCF